MPRGSLESASPLAQAHIRRRSSRRSCVHASRAARRAARDRLGARYRRLDRARRASPPRSLAAGRSAQRASRSSATSAPHPASSSTSTVKKLGRIVQPGHRVTGDRSKRAQGKAGWQHLFVAIDDHSRLGFASVYPDETLPSSIAFLDELVRFYALARDRGRARAHRQRRLLQAPLGGGLRETRDRGQEDARLSPTDQRQGRALHPHPARALGIRLSLRSTSPSVWPPYLRHSTSTIASVPTALSEASRRCSASTTSLGHTASSPS